jgi:hypothetical protein
MLDLWFEIPWWVRAPIACAIMAYGCFACLSGYQSWEHVQAEEKRTGKPQEPFEDRRSRSQFQIGFVSCIAGVGMLMISGRSKAEKNGYRSI